MWHNVVLIPWKFDSSVTAVYLAPLPANHTILYSAEIVVRDLSKTTFSYGVFTDGESHSSKTLVNFYQTIRRRIE
jgi:hypothetical protein